MREVTSEGDLNRYFIYYGQFITLNCHGEKLYITYTEKGRLASNTQKGIKKLIRKVVCDVN